MKAYPYTSIKLIDGKIKVVVNKKEMPNQDLTNFDDAFKRWQQNHEVFKFANPHEEGKIMRCIGGMNPQIKYGLEVTCIEIKDGLAYFKEKKERGITITNKDENKYIEDIICCYLTCNKLKITSDVIYKQIKSKYNITKKSHENEQSN